MTENELRYLMFVSSLRHIYFNDPTIKETYDNLPEELPGGQLDSWFSSEDNKKKLKYEDAEWLMRLREASFQKYLSNLLKAPCLDADGNEYPFNYEKLTATEEKRPEDVERDRQMMTRKENARMIRMVDDFFAGKPVLLAGMGSHSGGFMCMQATKDNTLNRDQGMVSSLKNIGELPKLRKDVEVKAVAVGAKTDGKDFLIPGTAAAPNPEKPKSGAFLNWLSKTFLGHPTQKWAGYESYQKQQKVSMAAQMADTAIGHIDYADERDQLHEEIWEKEKTDKRWKDSRKYIKEMNEQRQREKEERDYLKKHPDMGGKNAFEIIEDLKKQKNTENLQEENTREQSQHETVELRQPETVINQNNQPETVEEPAETGLSQREQEAKKTFESQLDGHAKFYGGIMTLREKRALKTKVDEIKSSLGNLLDYGGLNDPEGYDVNLLKEDLLKVYTGLNLDSKPRKQEDIMNRLRNDPEVQEFAQYLFDNQEEISEKLIGSDGKLFAPFQEKMNGLYNKVEKAVAAEKAQKAPDELNKSTENKQKETTKKTGGLGAV